MDSDGVLWKGLNSGVATAPAYTVVEIFIKKLHGKWRRRKLYRLSVKNGGNAAINFTNGWTLTAPVGTGRSGSTASIKIGRGITVTSSEAVTVKSEAAQFEINLGNGSVLTFDEFIVADIAGYGLVGGDTIVISGFAEKSLAINKHNSLADDALAYMQISGVDSSKLSWAFDTATNKYWLTVVPEPAEWAAIFSALTLGFVIYRRRK